MCIYMHMFIYVYVYLGAGHVSQTYCCTTGANFAPGPPNPQMNLNCDVLMFSSLFCGMLQCVAMRCSVRN